jgi:hypothetical protein
MINLAEIRSTSQYFGILGYYGEDLLKDLTCRIYVPTNIFGIRNSPKNNTGESRPTAVARLPRSGCCDFRGFFLLVAAALAYIVLRGMLELELS